MTHTADVQLVGAGRLLSDSALELQAADLRGRAGTVCLRSTAGPRKARKATVGLTLDADAIDVADPRARAGLLAELAAELGVPASRLKIKGL